ncbi:ABC-2 transporter permease [Bacillus bingmayongensis]|uniref:ABC-2 transporter permease n=1 Tax=Bacillus bingmayongensis TaxID=1150157 RepID=UPI001C8D9484|nr:ABC-2 transporter permease [Bacillus bingmayongensis]MBY0597303.1 ABC-2 transporter permease [Bacillus bingmayongensis]
MQQLVMKDFIVQWKFLIWYLLYPFLLYVISQDSRNVFTAIIIIIPILATMTTFHNDDKNSSEQVLNSLPVARKQIVVAKYIFSLLILIVSVMISSVMIGIEFGIEAISFIKVTAVSSINIVIIYLSFAIPIHFIFGYRKGRFITFIILLVPVLIGELFFKVNIEKTILQSSVLLSICAICLLFISILVCTKLYEQRDL